MPRFFIDLAYRGSNFCGWQRQPEQPSVQQHIEEALSTVLRVPTAIMGCGRTDTGVHASKYFAHFDCEHDKLSPNIVLALNGILPKSIVVYNIFQVVDAAHARFSAVRRSYVYHIHYRPNPFLVGQSWLLYPAQSFDLDLLQQAANVLLDYQDFAPFCKTNNNANTLRCDIMRAEWVHFPSEYRFEFHISANRFLRGMVRLIVGMCCSVASQKYELEVVHECLTHQTPLPKPWSVPPDGLFLNEVAYRKEHVKY